jgi:CheY-like chemotaxis protein/nitrogen-specific signal transduction histidine kinase
LRDQQGNVIGGVAVVADITERKRAQEALVEADRRKTEFLAILGHELRNPLAPIRNAVELLHRQESLPEKVRWAMDVIGRQCEKLEHLVNDLLDVSRISRGRIQLCKRPMRLQEVLADAIEGLAPLIRKSGHTLETRLPEAPVVVMGDPLRLAQVFTNLLSNAVKYTPDGGHIGVSLNQQGPTAVIRFCDDGVGIPAEHLPGLFEIFSRGGREHSNIRIPDGLGVGLALARSLVEQHGGILEGHSAGAGKGSEFVVSLPVQPGLGLRARSAEPRASAGVVPRARRILVVDDNPDVADSFRFLLESMGHQVRALKSGPGALATIREWRPDVVFLDIAMPGMDGYQVAAAIRAEGLDPAPLLVAVTGYGQDSDRRGAMAAGFDRHLLKPPELAQIEALLEELG